MAMPAPENSGGVIFWDFDGTLAHHPKWWSDLLAELLAAHDPAFPVTVDDLRPHLQTGFPWHTPEIPHPELSDPERWWERLHQVFRRAYAAVGVPEATGRMLARQVRSVFLAPHSWVVYEDVRPTLSALADQGWRHFVISNHVPELPELIANLGLGPFFDRVITSAASGYEKPHPEMYRYALDAAGRPGVAWMVGDNYVADVQGGEQAGLRAILVRNGHEGARWQCPDLRGVVEIVRGQPE